MNAGLILLIIVLLSFIGFGIYGLLWKYKFGYYWRYPKGKIIKSNYGDTKVHFIYESGSEKYFGYGPEKTARGCALACHCLMEEWEVQLTTYKFESGKPVIKEFAVHVANDELYEKLYEDENEKRFNIEINSSGQLFELMSKNFKRKMPLVVCRSSKFLSTPITGSLVVHELIHKILSFQVGTITTPNNPYDYNHTNENYWIGKNNLSLERRACTLYLGKKSKIGM